MGTSGHACVSNKTPCIDAGSELHWAPGARVCWPGFNQFHLGTIALSTSAQTAKQWSVYRSQDASSRLGPCTYFKLSQSRLLGETGQTALLQQADVHNTTTAQQQKAPHVKSRSSKEIFPNLRETGGGLEQTASNTTATGKESAAPHKSSTVTPKLQAFESHLLV